MNKAERIKRLTKGLMLLILAQAGYTLAVIVYQEQIQLLCAMLSLVGGIWGLAVLSPLANNLLFGMPPAPMLAPILVKSVLLAVAAGYAAAHFRRVSLSIMAGVVLFYQIVGSMVEWGMTGSVMAALQDFRLGIPGMALQIVGGYLFIKYLLRK